MPLPAARYLEGHQLEVQLLGQRLELPGLDHRVGLAGVIEESQAPKVGEVGAQCLDVHALGHPVVGAGQIITPGGLQTLDQPGAHRVGHDRENLRQVMVEVRVAGLLQGAGKPARHACSPGEEQVDRQRPCLLEEGRQESRILTGVTQQEIDLVATLAQIVLKPFAGLLAAAPGDNHDREGRRLQRQHHQHQAQQHASCHVSPVHRSLLATRPFEAPITI